MWENAEGKKFLVKYRFKTEQGIPKHHPISGSQGNFELNAMRPIIINNVLRSARILGDACVKLRKDTIEGIMLDRGRIEKFVNESLMLAPR